MIGNKVMNDTGYCAVVCDRDTKTVSINCDKVGLEYLKGCIDSLLKYNDSNLPQDISLMIPEWGGRGLTEEELADKNKTLICHLRLYRWE